MRERNINRRTIVCPVDRLQWRGIKQMTLPFRKPGGAAGGIRGSIREGRWDGEGIIGTGWPIYDGRLRIRGLPRAETDELLKARWDLSQISRSIGRMSCERTSGAMDWVVPVAVRSVLTDCPARPGPTGETLG
ncbi:MAG: hypothetical protein R2855_06285 [Thermomicrobiales bacterium]